MMLLGNIIFASFGILEAIKAGVWGLLCAALLWSGAILNGAMVSGESKLAFEASIAPPILAFHLAPIFVIENGGTLQVGLAIIAAGVLNGAAAIAVWERVGDCLSLMSEMMRALECGALDLRYQPKRDLRTRTITGVEALVRWSHPQRGQLVPDAFLPMAEETGRIASLTEWVLERAVEDQRRLLERGHFLSASVNLSGRLIDDEDFTRTVLRIAGDTAGKIILEVTETAIIGNPQVARQTLDALRRAGIGISIDDYGSGFSSLSYLKTVPADELKVDKAFVLGLADDRTDQILIGSVIDLAHSLGLQVVAEGVETEGALELLVSMGCDLAVI